LPTSLDVITSEISNSPSLVLSQGKFATNREFALGCVCGTLEECNKFVHVVTVVCELLQDMGGGGLYHEIVA
jgi:hypothetical protein